MTGRIEFTLETGQEINCAVSQLTLMTTKDEFWTWIGGHAAGTVSYETYTWLTGVLYPPEFVKSATTND